MNPALKALIPRRETVAAMMPKQTQRNPVGCITRFSSKDIGRIVAMRNNGMALQDIADEMECHLNTVWTHVSRAVARGECSGGRMTMRTK